MEMKIWRSHHQAAGDTTPMAGAKSDMELLQRIFYLQATCCKYCVCGFEAAESFELTNSAVFRRTGDAGRWMKKHQQHSDFAEMYSPDRAAYLEHWIDQCNGYYASDDDELFFFPDLILLMSRQW